MKKPYLIALAISLASCYACSKGPQMPPRVFPVVTDEVIQRDVPIYLNAIGNISSPWLVEVRPQITGQLLETHAREGREVEVGELLYVIDPAPFQAELDKAKATLEKDEAQLEFAKKKLERYEQLAKKDFVAALTYDQFQTDVKSFAAQVELDRATVKAAAINLGYTQITSPVVGRIGAMPVDNGNIVSPNDTIPLTYVRKMDPINVKFTLAQKDFQKLQDLGLSRHLPLEVLLSDATTPITGGTLTFVDNTFDTTTGTVMLKGSFPNRERLLWPGEFVRVRVLIETRRDAILVPSAAIQYGQPGSYIYVLKPDNTVELRVVKLGEELDGHFVVLDGVQPKETVITDGQINLRNGAAVIVTKKEPQAT
ncbi:MAG: efflux RND transporter periplasmic adaptor subunit [Chlamydiales bacterium]|nr:efflux RND transporter periplasmic adaptor subunit [Chlamydiales bacterium]